MEGKLMKLTKNQLEILYDLLKGLEIKTSDRISECKTGLYNTDIHNKIRQGNKELRVIRSVMRKSLSEIKQFDNKQSNIKQLADNKEKEHMFD